MFACMAISYLTLTSFISTFFTISPKTQGCENLEFFLYADILEISETFNTFMIVK